MTALKARAGALGLHGLLARWGEIAEADWLEDLITHEERERRARSFERRRAAARLPAFTPLADFDWTWPRHIDREAVRTLMTLEFISRADNAVLVGGQGTGKTMIAANIAHQALLRGHTVRFETAPGLLADLAALDSRQALLHRLTVLARPRLLILDEIGYVHLDSRLADILYTIIARRYRRRSTLVTTSLGFGQWDRVFPSAAGIAAAVDRLTHKATVITIDGDSWRLRHSGT
ncbi:MAG: IS21-like element helper ATPase IstB [Deltaproteobacteria bacterium]|nr:IS21-like element helper ATPase IstB [Deltaproteobacteria bacterium]